MFEEGLFGNSEPIKEGDRLVADVEPLGEADRQVRTFEATRVEAYGNVPVSLADTGESVGKLKETDDGAVGLFDKDVMRKEHHMADIRGATQTERTDLSPIDIGRDRNSGRFTPDITIAEPRSPADRNPDDGTFTTPDPRPITDIGRQRSDGLFDLF